VIAAAGSGQRLGAGGPKALVELAGRPLLAYALDACRDAQRVGPVIVAAPSGAEEVVQRLLDKAGISNDARIVAGGATRPESVRNALATITTPLVAIHDAARPLAGPGLLDGVLEALEARPDAAGVVAATAVTDTIKRAREPRPADGSHKRGGSMVEKTLTRDWLWAAQTPQAFRTEALRGAQEEAVARGDLEAFTDEAMLLERAGREVLIHPAPPGNLKVTTAADLRLVAALLGR
jgi:2-C-methyl-D-erythritol 4-phosphate cytidylyltransferase